MTPLRNLLVTAFLPCIIALPMLSIQARAAEVLVGAQVGAGLASHRIRSGTARGPAGAPALLLSARNGRIEIAVQSIPLSPTYSVPPGNGFQNIHLLFSNAVVRYWLGSRFAIGIGESLWNQKTYYNYARFGEADTFATRTVGTEYEIVEQMPLHADVLRFHIAIDPSMHGVESDRGDPFLPLPTRFEQSAAVEVAASWIHPVKDRTRLEAGVRYMQLTAKYDDGSFAYANQIVSAFVGMVFRVR